MSEEGRPLAQGLEFKADQKHVCQRWVVQVTFAFEEAYLMNEPGRNSL